MYLVTSRMAKGETKCAMQPVFVLYRTSFKCQRSW
jgi:hypothetical protein